MNILPVSLLALLPLSLSFSANAQDQTPSAATEAPIGVPTAEKLGWQVGVHAYTFKEFSIFEAIDKTKALGLKYMSISGSVSLDGKTRLSTSALTDADLNAIHQKCRENGITLLNMGVVQLPADEAKSRAVFEFAKKLGIDTLVAEPAPEALDTVDKLCQEYNIRVAIHNHPKPSHYWNPDTVLEAIKGRSPLLGACADTGHWIRSGLEPLDCVKKLEGHIFAFHFKDLAERDPHTHDVPWGNGVGNIKGVLQEMQRQKFKGAFLVEYEYHWTTSSPEIAEGVKYFEATCRELTAK